MEQTSRFSRFRHQFFKKKTIAKLSRRLSHHHDTSRVVFVGHKLLPQYTEEDTWPTYPDNTVVSSKYTLLTFLPKNLFEQLQRIANFYFLCVAIIQFVIDTPVTPMTSILPLVFVLTFTAIKQGYEDWLRHKADNEVNLRPAIIVRDGQHLDARAMDIKVGDIVKVQNNEEFPCDLVMLSSDDPNGQCFVTTANLDGETSLKTFYCLNETRQLVTAEDIWKLRAAITCMHPVADLYKFEGVMEFELGAESKPLLSENLLLRGARLKNNNFIYGCAVYTGKDTKMAMNSKSKKIKFSRVERKMNSFLIVILIVLLLESVLTAALMFWFEGQFGVPWYVSQKKTDVQFVRIVEHALASMVLYNYIIPISLYVTVEMQKFLGSLYFGMDLAMYDEVKNERAKANTSDLNEELGQVEYLFTDKTGTLTENQMIFQKCCIWNRQYEMLDGVFCEKLDDGSLNTEGVTVFTDEMNRFFRALVLCHTVRLDHHILVAESSDMSDLSQRESQYQASSPDEKALVMTAYRLGIIFNGMTDNIIEVSFHGKTNNFKLLQTLPFDPIRKRMSIIVEDDENKYWLLCKGAEVAILDRITNGDVDWTQNLINEYAVLGLRTLAIAERELTPIEFQEMDKMLNDARKSMYSREEKLADVYSLVETQLTLLGATAVEDRLQDQVPQTIEALRMAGIKVWVLTGDKEETAVNISYAAGHFHNGMHELRLTKVSKEEECQPQLEELMAQVNHVGKTEFAFIVDGQSLAYALKDPLKETLRELCSKCSAVLCCRMSPMQKAEVVAMIKYSPEKPVTAAIGDGANDVSMIQEADVGLAIMGNEGRQAVRNSDYAFGKFKFLRNALLFHGHLYYHRIAILVQYFFYKNVAWITAQLLYAIFNCFSQQSLFDPYYLMFYNLTFTSLPILIFGLFEQHIPRDELLNNPSLYRRISRNSTLSWYRFIQWNGLGLWHCLTVFFGMYFLNMNGVPLFESGKGIGIVDLGTMVLLTSVLIVNLKLLLETYYWCIPTLIGYAVTLIGFMSMAALYTNIYFPSSIMSHQDLYKSLGQIYSAPIVWLAMLVLVIAALLPDFVLRMNRDTTRNVIQFGYTNPKRRSSIAISVKTSLVKDLQNLDHPSSFIRASKLSFLERRKTDTLEPQPQHN